MALVMVLALCGLWAGCKERASSPSPTPPEETEEVEPRGEENAEYGEEGV